jgi:hypothetical protein
MKLLASGLVLILGCFLAVSMSDAKGPPSVPTPGNNGPGNNGPGNSANSRAKVRPQIRANQLNGRATPHTQSPAPGRGKAMSRIAPSQRLARRQKGHGDKTIDPAQATIHGLGKGHMGLAHNAPRDAMTRSLSKRLSQIDKIRDKALETGDLDLLELADGLELRARRKFDEMIVRIDQRQELGKPGVGPPVLLPAVEPDPEPDVPETDLPSDPTSPPDGNVSLDGDILYEDPIDSEAAAEPEIVDESETAQE